MPGRYKIVAEQAGQKDSTWITVKDDPRLGNRTDIRIAQQKMRDRLRVSGDRLTEALDKLSDAEEVLGKVETQYKDVKGDAADSIRKSTKSMQDSVRSIRDFISGKRQTRQGFHAGFGAFHP